MLRSTVGGMRFFPRPLTDTVHALSPLLLYFVIGIAIDPTVDSLHLCGEHVLAPGNYPLVVPSGYVPVYLNNLSDTEAEWPVARLWTRAISQPVASSHNSSDQPK